MMIRISGSFTQILLAWMNRQGIDNPGLASKVQLLANKESIPAAEWRALLQAARAVCNTPHLGIQIGAEVQVQHAGVLGYLLLNSRNLADALETYLLCERHFYGVHFAELDCNAEYWALTWPDYLGEENALFAQVSLAALATFVRQRFPGVNALRAVALPGHQPPDLGPYEAFFACPVSFASQRPGLTFDARLVHSEAAGSLSGDFQSMRVQQVQALSGVIKVGDPFLQRLQHVLLTLMPAGKASLPQVATALNCSVRSVQRGLSRYNLSYQGLLDGVREERARRYLLRTTLSLSEIALLLGFSDQSAFTRAFKCWCGTSPGGLRKAQG